MVQQKSLDSVVAALTYFHSQDQDTIANNLVAAMAPLWPEVDFYHLDATTIAYVEATASLVQTAYLQSQRAAAIYSQNVRFASLATEPPLPISIPNVEFPIGMNAARFVPPVSTPSTLETLKLSPPDLADFKRGLLAESNFAVKAAMPGDPNVVMRNAQINSQGVGVQRAMNGGRNASSHVVLRDRRVIGYARVTDGNPCYFCAMLAARGAVYKKASFAKGGAVNYNRASEGLTKADRDFVPNERAIDVPDDYVSVAKVHNHCCCSLRPVYSKSQEFDADAKFYKAQWDSIFVPGAGEDNVIAFRKQYKAFERPGADVVDITSQLQERGTALLNAGFSPASPQVQWATTASNLLAV